MENGALSTVIKPNKFGPFMEPLVSAITAQVLRGLAYLHEQGVVHRDIKGANILTTKEVRCSCTPGRSLSVPCSRAATTAAYSTPNAWSCIPGMACNIVSNERLRHGGGFYKGVRVSRVW